MFESASGWFFVNSEAFGSECWNDLPDVGGYQPICQHDLGFYLWIACAAVLGIFAVIDLSNRFRLDVESKA